MTTAMMLSIFSVLVLDLLRENKLGICGFYVSLKTRLILRQMRKLLPFCTRVKFKG